MQLFYAHCVLKIVVFSPSWWLTDWSEVINLTLHHSVWLYMFFSNMQQNSPTPWTYFQEKFKSVPLEDQGRKSRRKSFILKMFLYRCRLLLLLTSISYFELFRDADTMSASVLFVPIIISVPLFIILSLPRQTIFTQQPFFLRSSV